MPAQLVVSEEDSPKDIKIRGLFIFVDGKEIGDLSYGNMFEVPLEPGTHQLRVSTDSTTRKQNFDLEEGEKVEFQAGNFISGFWAVVLGWSGFMPYKVFLERLNRKT